MVTEENIKKISINQYQQYEKQIQCILGGGEKIRESKLDNNHKISISIYEYEQNLASKKSWIFQQDNDQVLKVLPIHLT
ncbi:hypothetical protein Glove_86g85 [Diversispora epigaea]|uniref:Uncharacterized protein n=1 Tax=Diversispora epigaea TaxID=1348612 RepID=A0A397J791_9GLOM|nr:hypothetical protein Glove_86g85 [Diversispora epigaea]